MNINLANYTRFAEHSYFTKQAFIRGEVVDACFPMIPARSWSCWWGIRRPPQEEEEAKEEEAEEEEEESEPKETQPQPTPLGDVPMLTYPIQSELGTSSDHPPI